MPLAGKDTRVLNFPDEAIELIREVCGHEIVKRRWSVRKFARKAGVGQRTAVRFLEEIHTTSPVNIAKMARAVGLDVVMQIRGHIDD